MALRIEPMSAEWVPAVAALERASFSDPWSERSLRGELSNPRAVFLLALEGETLCGYAGMHHIADEGHITNIAVDAQFRRRGVARALLDALHAYARKHRLAFVTLEVREGNTPAIALYERCGYSRVGLRSGYYTHPAENALLMTRFLELHIPDKPKEEEHG